MKLKAEHLKIYVCALITLFFCHTAQGQLTGTYTVPGTVGTTSVNNLSDLAGLLSTSTVNGTAVFEFTASYSSVAESYPITFTPFTGSGKVIIRPALSVSASLSTSGNPGASALVDLFEAQNITFDGRPGGKGSTIEWLFSNTGSGSSYPTFRFINGAQYDTLKYLNIEGSQTNLANSGGGLGVVLFSTTTTGGGNSFNAVEYCNIAPASSSPYNGIYSYGTAGTENSSNSILGNNISNFQGYFSSGPYGGINIAATGNGSNWNIVDNSIYSTYINGFYDVSGIVFNAGSKSNGNIISGNYVGGSQPLCGGTPWLFAGSSGTPSPDFNGIYVNANTATVSHNTVQNIKSSHEFDSHTLVGINIAGGNINVYADTVGSPTAANSFHNESMGVTLGIWNESPDTVIINGNVVANITLDDSFPPTGATYGQVSGIYCSASANQGAIGPCTITNNQVYKLSSIIAYNINQYYYINSGGGTFSTNLIANFGAMAGIYLESNGSTTNLISENIVHDILLNVTSSSDVAYIYGIGDVGSGGTTTINGNLVYGLWAPDTYGQNGAFLEAIGLYMTSSTTGTFKVNNNMIDLGTKPTDGTAVQNVLFSGIWDNSTDNNVKLKLYILHNSVYIDGTDNNAKTNNLDSYAFTRNFDYTSTVYDSLLLENNIFQNNRSTSSGTGNNYGLYLNDIIDVKDDYNDIYGTGTRYLFGSVLGTGYASLATFKISNAGHEGNSISSNPQYTNPTGLVPDLHITNSPSVSPIDKAGTATATIVYDYDSLIRANYTPVDIGAVAVCSATSSPAQVTLTVAHDTLCNSAIVDTFTATPVSGGTAPKYNFYLNGVSVQNGSSNIYIPTTLHNNDSVKVVLTSNAACTSPLTATSNSITIDVLNANVVPLVTMSPSANNICHGASVTFTANGTNGGSAPSYNFYVNGVLKQNGAGKTYTNNSLNNGDSVKVIFTSDAACASPTTASSSVAMVVNPNVVPQVSLTASQNNVCSGTSITFTASPTNQGTSPSYNFYINGTSVQNGASATYSTGSLKNNDSVYVVLTSNAVCDSPSSTTTSNKVLMIITPKVQPGVSLSANRTTICPNTSITFTATPTNGGNAPAYNFFVNNASKQNSASATYSTSSLQNGDSVYVVITGSGACDSPSTATSSKIYITVSSAATPQASIGASENNICQGTSVTFTASTLNGGDTIAYNFFVNGTSKQNGSGATYSTSSLNNGDKVWVVSTNTGGCISTPTAYSDTLSMNIIANVTPTVSISASQTTICYGAQVSFTTSATNAGSNATYNFYKNGNSVQSGSSDSYASDSLHNGDVIYVVLTSTAACAQPVTATSTQISITVSSNLSTVATLTASADSVCFGSQVTLSASATNVSTNANYDFFQGGNPVQNGTNPSYTFTLTANTQFWVVVTSDLSCSISGPVSSDTVSLILITPVNPDVSLIASVNNVCAGTSITFTASGNGGGNAPDYNFYVNGNSVQSGVSDNYITSALSNNDQVWVVLTSSALCASPAEVSSDTFTSIINPAARTTLNQGICSGSTFEFDGHTLNRSGTYYDTLTTANGCDSIIILNLSITNTVRVQIADSICLGGSYQFGNRILQGGGIYLDTVPSSGGCDSITTLTLVVVPKPSPEVQQLGGDSLSTDVFTSYQWLDNGIPIDQATNQYYVVTKSGFYSVAVTGAGGCGDTSAGLNIVTSISEVANNLAIQLYPNPAQDILTLKIQGLQTGEFNIRLSDITGKVILRTTSSSNRSEYSGAIDLSSCTSGIYFLHIQAGDLSLVRKVDVVK